MGYNSRLNSFWKPNISVLVTVTSPSIESSDVVFPYTHFLVSSEISAISRFSRDLPVQVARTVSQPQYPAF